MVCKKQGPVIDGDATDLTGDRLIARSAVWHSRDPSSPHHDIRRDRRQHIVLGTIVKTGQRRGVCGVKMHHGAITGPASVHGQMKPGFLGGLSAVEVSAVGSKATEFLGLECS